MWRQTNGEIDIFLDFAGSGGTFTGCAKTLKKYNLDIRCYLVEPYSTPFYSGKPLINPNHKIQGGGIFNELASSGQRFSYKLHSYYR